MHRRHKNYDTKSLSPCILSFVMNVYFESNFLLALLNNLHEDIERYVTGLTLFSKCP